ncbi:hypothetical protein [Amycolatopsis anabasis]|uniref:hypothetical protein n=1 Tax=Amycolatopsis anabasis TaxID=1840409 RepID=UPI00131A897C|nr:hypothetical protein [Amycolatopsis anabasis]
MRLLVAERIKLFSIQSPWLCLVGTLGVLIGTGVLQAVMGKGQISPADSQAGVQIGIAVVLVLATLAITTEYRCGTIRTTFQAVPDRPRALVAKVVVVAVTTGLAGLVGGFGAWAAAAVLDPDRTQGLHGFADWRTVLGASLLFAFAAVLAVAVGTLLRHTAGAVALLLIYSLQGERLIALIPNAGPEIYKWLPIHVGQNFIAPGPEDPLGPWGSLAYFAACAVALFVLSAVVANKRDA